MGFAKQYRQGKESVEMSMVTEIIKINPQGNPLSDEEDAALRRAGNIIKGGGLVAFPTETVYGLGGDALNGDSCRKIYEAKGRPSDNPLIIHVSCFEDIRSIVAEVPEAAKKIADAFWPGPLTMILQKSDRVPREVTGGLDTVALRLPSHPIARKFIEYSGGYVAAPSANTSGKPSPTLAEYVVEDMQGRIPMIIDGGSCDLGLESTIIDVTTTPPQILRPGYITQQMLEEVLGDISLDQTMMHADQDQAPRAPGMKYRHYAPAGELTVVEGDPEAVVAYINQAVAKDEAEGKKTGVIGTAEYLERYHADSVKCIGSRDEEASIAKNLYAILRAFDDEAVQKIYSESFSAEGLGQAIMNRLLKASGHRVVRLEEEPAEES